MTPKHQLSEADIIEAAAEAIKRAFLEDGHSSEHAFANDGGLSYTNRGFIAQAVIAAMAGFDAPILAAIVEAMELIEYHDGDMRTEHERNHPRGSGWARVYDKLAAARDLLKARAA